MSFNTNTGKQSYTASSGQTDFDFNFKIFQATDIKVFQTPHDLNSDDVRDLLVYPTDYSVVVDGDDGGTITLNLGTSLDDTIVIVRDLPAIRDTSYVTNGELKADTLNIDQDYQTYLISDGFVALDSAITLPISSLGVSPKLPAVIADSYLKWNTAGDALENDTTIPQAVVDSAASAASALASEQIASSSATSAELNSWTCEAEKLTADSYATEPVNVFVKLYSSNGDGTISYVKSNEYSSLHWSTQSLLNIGAFNKNSTLGIDTGTANAIQIDNIDYILYFPKMIVEFIPKAINTGASTLRIKGLEAKALKYNGANIGAGYLKPSSIYIAIYDLENDRFNVDVLTGEIATETARGKVELATQVETNTGTDDTRAITPIKLKTVTDLKALKVGDNTQIFKVKNAVNADEAVNKGQMDNLNVGADISLSNLNSTGGQKVCKVWINFNGSNIAGNPIIINDSFNVSTVGDNGTGDYTVNYIQSITNTNYSVLVAAAFVAGDKSSFSSLETSSLRVKTISYLGPADTNPICVNVFGN